MESRGVNNQSPRERSVVNKSPRSVRKRRAEPEGDDRRVRRTRHVLTLALIDLVREKRYDAITIQNLLDRADVGRSTFYAHYRGKDDLLLRSWERMLDMLDGDMTTYAGSRRRIAPVRELFHHVGEFAWFHRALARAHMLDRVYQAGTVRMSEMIGRRLVERGSTAADSSPPLPVLTRALAGAVFALLAWWIEEEEPYSPDEMDEMFHSIRL